MSLRNFAFIHIILIAFLLLSTSVLLTMKATQATVVFAQTTMFITYFWILFSQISINGFKHVFTIFLGLFFLFLLGISFFDLIGGYDIRTKNLFVNPVLSSATLLKTYVFTSLVLSFIFLGILFGYKSPSNIHKNEVSFSPNLFIIGLILFFISLPGILTKYYLQLQVVFDKGYLSIYDGSLQQIDYPLICTGSGTLLIIGYCLFIASKPSQKYFLLITGIFLFTQMFNMLKGQRSVLMFPFVFVFWYFFKFFSLKLSFKKLAIIVLIVVVLSQMVSVFRSDDSYIKAFKNKTFTEKYISGFFEEQGVSFFILPYMIHYELKNDRYPYLFAPFYLGSFGKPQSMERLQKFNYLPDQLMYKILPKEFKMGLGLGSSYLGVMYDLPKIIAMFFCILFGYVVARFEVFVMYSRLLMVSSYYIVFAIASSLRFEPFQLIYDILILWVIYFTIIMLISISNKFKTLELNKV